METTCQVYLNYHFFLLSYVSFLRSSILDLRSVHSSSKVGLVSATMWLRNRWNGDRFFFFFFVWNGERSRFFPLLFFFFSFFLIFHLLSFFLEVHLHFTFSYFYKYQKPHVTKSNLFRWIWVLRKERSRFSVCYYFSFDLFFFNRRSFSLHYELGSVHDIYTTVLFTRFYSYSTLRTRITN